MDNTTTDQIQIWAGQIRQSDRQAFDALFRKLYPRLVYFAKGLTKDKSAACDIVQDVFVVLWQKRVKINPDRSLTSFIYTMTRNRALNHIRDRAGIHPLDDEEQLSIKPANENIHAEDEQDEIRLKFEKWIEELPSRQQESFKLSRFDGLDHEEISEVMGISAKTVNNHIVAALKHLRDRHNGYKTRNNNMKS